MIGNHLEPFKFWCQKVLPNVYDDSLSYYEYLCKLNEYLNEVIEQINTLTDNMSDYEDDLTAQWTTYSNDLTSQWTTYRNELSAQWQTYKTYIDTYFDNLDVQQEINNKLDQMALNGTLSSLIEPFVGTDIQNSVNAWLTAHVDPVGSAVIVDNTLSITGAAADAKAVGDEFALMKNLAVQDYMCDKLSYTASGVTIEIDHNDISISGTANENVGYDIINSGRNFKLINGNSYNINWNVPLTNKRIILQVAYKETAESEYTNLLRYDTSETKKTLFSGTFTVPNSYYLFIVSISVASGTYNDNSVLSITNSEILNNVMKNSNSIDKYDDISVNEYMCNTINTTLYGVTYTVNNEKIHLSGTSTQTEGLFVLDNRSNIPCYFEPNKKYHLHLDGLNFEKHTAIIVAYRSTQGGTLTPLIEVHSTTNNGTNYDNSFTVPSSYYQIFVSVTTYNGITYDDDLILSITNFATHIKSSNEVILNENTRKINSLGYSYRYYERPDGTVTNNNVTITKKGSTYLMQGVSNATNSYNIIEGNGIFKSGETIYLNYNKDDKNLYLQVICKTTNSAQEQALLSTKNNGHYKVTMPSNIYYIRIALVYTNNLNLNNAVIHLYINNFETIENKIFYTSQFDNNLTKTVKEAEKYYGSTVILDSGTYDIVNEFVDYYGETFFTNYQTYNVDGWGLVIGNGMTLRGQSNTKIVCDCGNYVTETNRPDNKFSIFMLSDDCILENLTLEGANCRYCVHDDWYDKTLKSKHKYFGCKMKHSGSGIRCIGGGLVNATEIIVDNCYFEDSNTYPVAYHNCVNDNAQSSIIIKDCYFNTGGITLSNYGPSTLKTRVFVCGNSYTVAPEITYTEQSTYGVDNMELIAYNNTLRT